MIQVVVFWIVTPCGDAVGYQRLGVSGCLRAQGEDRRQNSEAEDLNLPP